MSRLTRLRRPASVLLCTRTHPDTALVRSWIVVAESHRFFLARGHARASAPAHANANMSQDARARVHATHLRKLRRELPQGHPLAILANARSPHDGGRPVLAEAARIGTHSRGPRVAPPARARSCVMRSHDDGMLKNTCSRTPFAPTLRACDIFPISRGQK